jgi:hypothetical protein
MFSFLLYSSSNYSTPSTFVNKTPIFIMNTNDYKHIQNNGTITFDFENGVVTTIKRSPRGNDCWWAEHQCGQNYTLFSEEDDRLYFTATDPDGSGVRKTGWWINKKTGFLYVLATHTMGDRVVEYKPDEFSLKLVYDHELDGFWDREISPTWREEEWFRLKGENLARVAMVKIGDFYEVFHDDAILFRDTFGFPLMPSARAHTGFPKNSLVEFTKGMDAKSIEYTIIKQD